MSQLFRLILGIATFCICIWIRFDLDFWEWVIEINWYTYWYCTYFIMITMILVVINSLIGAYAIIYVSTLTPLLTKDFTRCFHEIWNSFFVKACGKQPIYYEIQIGYIFLFYNSRKGLDLFYSLLFPWEYFWCLNLLVLLLFASMVSRRVHVRFSFK